MITDARVLQPEFVPGDIVHRDREVYALSGALKPLTRNEPAETAFLFGPSGVGKTCIAQHTVEHLRENILELNHQYVNCWEDYSRYKTLYRVLEGVGQTFDVHRQSTPTDELLDRVREYDGPPYVVILDEADQLRDPDVLYELYRTRGLYMVLIANREEELFTYLDDRLRSRLQTAVRIQFDRYGMEALRGILEDRVRWGLVEDAVSEEQLTVIADSAGGDARTAIGILRNAARIATQDGREEIWSADVEEAIPEAKAEIKQKDIEKLTPDQRVLYEIVSESKEISPGELYKEYRARIDDPKTNRMVRNYLEKMKHYNLIRAEGENRGRTYRIAGDNIS